MNKELTQKEIGTPQPIVPGLYLVATPIGNLRDITLRALDVLEGADEIYCEDTRVTGKLLQAYGLKTRMAVYNDHSGDSARQKIIQKIKDGKAVALVSDAGTPLISDPGYKLVKECLEAGVTVTGLPGANAVLTGLQLSGLPTDTFTFHGFLPAKKTARQKYLKGWKSVQTTSVFYESGKRLLKSLQDIESVMGERDVSVARELTKRYEDVKTDTLFALIGFYKEKGTPKGEIVIVVGPPAEQDVSYEEVDALLKKALTKQSVKEAATEVADITGRSKKELYERALALKE